MENEKSNRTVWIVIGILVGVLFVCSVSGLIGGAIGYALGARQARPCEPYHQYEPSPWHNEDEWCPRVPQRPDMPDMPIIPQMPIIPDMPMQPELPERIEPESQSFGALVVEIVPGGPADDAGLDLGDVIVMVDDRPLPNGDLQEMMNKYRAGDSIGLLVLRAGEPTWVRVQLGRRPESRGDEPYLGITYRIMPLGSRGLD